MFRVLSIDVLAFNEEAWLVNKGTVKINYNELDYILSNVGKTNNNLFILGLEVKYTEEQRLYLLNIIDILDSLEETIESIMNEKLEAH